jgi:hypothetical protein
LPPRSARRAQKKDDTATVVTITVDGEPYLFDSSEITYKVELELFHASRLTMDGVFKALAQDDFAPFLVAALVFLARRSAGDKVTFDQVASSIEYSSEVGFKIGRDDESQTEDSPPEAPAAD